MEMFVVSLDQGTTSSRAIAFDKGGKACAVFQKEFTQIFPQPGWVEHDPREIWESQLEVLGKVADKVGPSSIASLGITNQRETTIVWSATDGRPIYNAIVWQDRRTSQYCEQLRSQGYAESIREKTGLLIDPYFSGTKIRWILDNVPGARERAERGELRFGNVDSWLIWNLTCGRVHATDCTNASRTMLFNIRTMEWDKDLLSLLSIPESMMPEVRSCSEIYGYWDCRGKQIPISGVAGDQQSSLFGQMCTECGNVKNTYGTGCFLLMNTGSNIVKSENNLLSTIAWNIDGHPSYALEGSVFVAGSVVQWLRDGLGIIESSADVEALAATVEDDGGVVMVPSLTGLGAPYWDADARGAVFGITRGTTSGHIARAALEGIAFETMDVVDAMMKDSGQSITELKVDGGASRNNLLMQFQSDILSTSVIRPREVETTAIGAAFLSGLASGFWSSLDQIRTQWKRDREFSPELPAGKIAELRNRWHDAIQRVRTK